MEKIAQIRGELEAELNALATEIGAERDSRMSSRNDPDESTSQAVSKQQIDDDGDDDDDDWISNSCLSCATAMEQGIDAGVGYAIEESSWDASLFIGILVSPIDSIILSVLIVVNYFFQSVFTFTVWLRVVDHQKNQYSNDSRKAYLEWRTGIGHHARYWDATTNTSLATRICTNYGASVLAGHQQSFVDDMGSYLNKLDMPGLQVEVGSVLCVIAITIWLMYIVLDVIGNYSFTTAILSTPTSRQTTVIADGDMYTIKGLSCIRKIGTLCFVSAPRLVVSCFLGYAGVAFLVASPSLSHLVLNCVALTFILQCDELTFLLAPKNVQTAVKQMSPMYRNSTFSPGRKYCDCRSCFSLILLFVAVPIIYAFMVRDFQQTIEITHANMCKGVTNFVYVHDQATGVMTVAPTKSDDELAEFDLSESKDYQFKAILQRTELLGEEGGTERDPLKSLVGTLPSDTIWSPASSSRELFNMATETFLIASNHVPCEDIDANSSVRRAMSSMGLNSTVCRELNHSCHREQVRVFCSNTCGCSDALSGMWMREGCTSNCDFSLTINTGIIAESAHTSGEKCKDLPDSIQLKVPTWHKKFFTELQVEMESLGRLTRSSSGQPVFSDSASEEFQAMTNKQKALNKSVEVDFPAWALAFMQNSRDDKNNCSFVKVFDQLLGVDLCATTTNFASKRGSVEPFCPMTCGKCKEGPSAEIGGEDSGEERWDDLAKYFEDIGVPLINWNRGLVEGIDDAAAELCEAGLVRGNNIGKESRFGNPAGDALYGFTVPEDGWYMFYTHGNFNGFLRLVEKETGEMVAIDGGGDDVYCTSTYQQLIEVERKKGDELILVVEGTELEEGCFDLLVICPSSPESNRALLDSACPREWVAVPETADALWILGDAGASCDAACSALGGACHLRVVNDVQDEDRMRETATMAGHACSQLNHREDYAFTPAICTSSSCCEGDCVDSCYYGGATTCAAEPGGDHRRLCPCVGIPEPEPCTCREEWTDDTDDGCSSTQFGCPAASCSSAVEEGDSRPWCLVSNGLCAEEEMSEGDGWMYCEPEPESLSENSYYVDPDVGGWGGICTCPDGQQYAVGDNSDSCETLACVGGTYSSCFQNDSWAGAHRKVVCALPQSGDRRLSGAAAPPGATPAAPASAATPASSACQVTEITLHTEDYGYEVSWEIRTNGSAAPVCSGPGGPNQYDSERAYTIKCCLPAGEYTVRCIDSHGDGWHGARVAIGGSIYCEDFDQGRLYTEDVSVWAGCSDAAAYEGMSCARSYLEGAECRKIDGSMTCADFKYVHEFALTQEGLEHLEEWDPDALAYLGYSANMTLSSQQQKAYVDAVDEYWYDDGSSRWYAVIAGWFLCTNCPPLAPLDECAKNV